MKKLISLTVAAALAVSLAACGATAATDTSSTTTDASSATAGTSTATDTGAAASESTWPTDTVTLYVPAKAGGGTDMLGRLFIQGMTETNGANYIIVNDTTGNGTVAAEQVRNAAPDGLNLLMYHSGLNAATASGQYNHSLDDFTILGLFITPVDMCSSGVFVSKDSQFETMEELIAYAKENPGKLVSGVQNGATSQFGEALMEKTLGIESTMVEAGSNADKVTALMGNQIDYVYMNIGGNEQYLESGDLRLLVQVGPADDTPKNTNVDAGIPTFAELGYANMPTLDMIGFIAGPKGMSDEDIAEINRVMKGAAESQTVLDGYAKLNTTVEYATPDEAAAAMAQSQKNYDEAYAIVSAAN